MSNAESPATPGRLARISTAQAVGTIAETAFFGSVGVLFAFIGLVIAALVNLPGAVSFGNYVVGTPEIHVYIFASGVLYVSLLIAFRTQYEAGLDSPPELERDHPDTRIEEIIEEISRIIAVASYTAAVITIGGILSYEFMAISPVLGILVIVGYPYFEHTVMLKSAEKAESPDDVSTPITPGLLGAAAIAMVMMFLATPFLIGLRMIGLIASLQEQLPSFEALSRAIRDAQEHLVFLDSLMRKGGRMS